MKPIEIHIEGYKIVISEDKKEPEVTVEKETEKINYVPYPYPVIQTAPNTPQNLDWWNYPYVTCTHYDETNLTNTYKTADTPVRDCMVGKERK